jgi:hypothetical protein
MGRIIVVSRGFWAHRKVACSSWPHHPPAGGATGSVLVYADGLASQPGPQDLSRTGAAAFQSSGIRHGSSQKPDAAPEAPAKARPFSQPQLQGDFRLLL